MLYINNPEARTAIIEQSRIDNGQHVVGVAGDVSAGAVARPKSRTSFRYRAQPVVSA